MRCRIEGARHFARSGAFLRAGWNDGRTESWAFTEVERTLTAGLQVAGPLWHRPAERLGLAAGLNGINRDHRDYLAHGGYGFMLGDGRLTYAAERVIDAYYSLAVSRFLILSLEAQRFENLAFNRATAARSPSSACGRICRSEGRH